mgnify:CR=1 FL=1
MKCDSLKSPLPVLFPQKIELFEFWDDLLNSEQYHQRLHSWEEAEILVTNSEGEYVSHDVHHFAELRNALNNFYF